jgi:hypothetical protein
MNHRHDQHVALNLAKQREQLEENRSERRPVLCYFLDQSGIEVDVDHSISEGRRVTWVADYTKRE